MTLDNKYTGSRGERIASDFLLDNGFRIINRNVRTRFGEIDIITLKDNVIHFVEVKTRIGDTKGKPYEAVTYYKMNHMRRSAEVYVLQNRLGMHKLSLDVVSIIMNPNQTVKELTFFENVTK